MIRMHKAKPTAVAIAITMLVTGCATIDKQVAENDSWVSCIGGGLLGAVAGAAIGATQGGSDKVLIGTIAGAAVGCGGGLWYKNRVDRLEKIAKEEGLKMQVRELQLAAAQADQKKKANPPLLAWRHPLNMPRCSLWALRPSPRKVLGK